MSDADSSDVSGSLEMNTRGGGLDPNRSSFGRGSEVKNQHFDETESVTDEDDSMDMRDGPGADAMLGRGPPRQGDSPPASGLDDDSLSDSDSGMGDGSPDMPGQLSNAGMPSMGAAGGEGGRGAGAEGLPGDDSSDSDSDSDDSGDDASGSGSPGSRGAAPGKRVEGSYDPAEYKNLAVSPEIRDLFEYIQRYKPHEMDLDTHLQPFVPDYIPSIGDIDAFLKVPRPADLPEKFGNADLGLTVVDESCAHQSDPTVLDLQLRSFSKQESTKKADVKSVENAAKHPKQIENWVASIKELHLQKPPPNVVYSKPMPDIEPLMQVWATEFEDLLTTGEVSLPTAELDVDLQTYAALVCNLLDIPTHEGATAESLHVLFELYSEMNSNAAIAGGAGQVGGGVPAGLQQMQQGGGGAYGGGGGALGGAQFEHLQMGSAEVQTL